jgi:hypothetical protein
VIALVTLAVMMAVPLARIPIWRLIVTIRKDRVFVRQQRH